MDVPLIDQVKIQAQILVPLVKALQAELGKERANDLVRRTLGDIYRGVVPYILIQVLVIATVIAFPAIATWLPDKAFDLSLPHHEKFKE